MIQKYIWNHTLTIKFHRPKVKSDLLHCVHCDTWLTAKFSWKLSECDTIN